MTSRWGGKTATSFRPGCSGNPGGRPKAIVEVVALAKAQTAASIAALVRIRDMEDAPAAAVVAAASALLDRAWGRPTQMLAGDGEGPLIIDFRWADSTTLSPPRMIDADVVE